MSENEQGRTEQPTPFKLKRAREKGAVARGSDLGFLTGMATFLGFLWIAGPDAARGIGQAARTAILSGMRLTDEPNAALAVVPPLFGAMVWPILSLVGSVFAVVLLFEILQTGIVFSAQPLTPDFSRLNPATGFKRLFTVRLLLETFKNILKIGAYTAAGYLVIRGVLRSEAGQVGDAGALLTVGARMAFRLLAAFVGVAAVFAVLDQVIVRRDFLKRMAMSRREVRREARDREGDPRLKQRRKQLHAEFSKMSQSLRNIKGADVVITNPDHIALALRYNPRTMPAPTVVSMGINRFAQYLKWLALLHGVVVIENRALARALYNPAALNKPIPNHCFQPVADIYNALRRRRDAQEQAS